MESSETARRKSEKHEIISLLLLPIIYMCLGEWASLAEQDRMILHTHMKESVPMSKAYKLVWK